MLRIGHHRARRGSPSARHGVSAWSASDDPLFLRYLAGDSLDVFAYYRSRWPRRRSLRWLTDDDPVAPAQLHRRLLRHRPLFISVAAVLWLFRLVDGLVGPVFIKLLGPDPVPPGLGILTTALAILIVGAVATNVVGKRLLQRAEWLLLHVPLFRSIYAPVKQLVVAFSPDNDTASSASCWSRTRRAASARLSHARVHDRPGTGSRNADRGLRADQSPLPRRHRDLPARSGVVSRHHRRARNSHIPDRWHGHWRADPRAARRRPGGRFPPLAGIIRCFVSMQKDVNVR